MKGKFATIAALMLLSGGAFAQSVGNGANPGRADTTDPNSAPRAVTPGTPIQDGRATTGQRTLDPAGRANTSDPQSTQSGGTGASGQPHNPMANPRQR